MSTLLGVLTVSGKGGSELFVFDDALVRASTGMGLAVSLFLDGDKEEGKQQTLGAAIASGMSGDLSRYAHLSPEQIAQENKDNKGVWVRDVTEATLKAGRWPSVGLRRLTLTLNNGESRVYDWAGPGATRPMNDDEDAATLLGLALGPVLTTTLKRVKD